MSVITKFELPGSKRHYNPDKLFEVQHIFLDMFLDFEKESTHNTAFLQILPIREELSQIKLDACEMEIFEVKIFYPKSSLKLDKNSESLTKIISKASFKKLEFSHDNKKLEIFLPEITKSNQNFILAIDYKTEKSEMGLSFVKPNEYYPDKPTQAWSKGEAQMSRYWYPCLDFPKQICTSEIRVRVPKQMTAVSNGQLLKKTDFIPKNKDVYQNDFIDSNFEKKDYVVFHWHQTKAHPNYLICLAVGEFAEIKDKYGDIEVNYYTNKAQAKQMEITAKKTPKMIKFFEQKFGVKYPWSKYHQIWVHDFIWGGMENTSSTINTDKALNDQKANLDFDFPEILIAHELSHQWFGDLVAIDHWSHLWVKEGAATYSESLWWEHEYGVNEFNYYRLNEWREYMTESYQRPIVTNFYRHWEDMYDRHSYTKAGTLYHMIRTEIGEKYFTEFLKLFLEQNSHKNVEGVDLLRAAEKVSGKNLRPLFDQYLNSSGHPCFKVAYSWDSQNKILKLDVAQTQTKDKEDHDNVFKLKLPIAFGFADNKKIKSEINKKNLQEVSVNKQKVFLKTIHIEIKDLEQSFYFPLDQKPDFVSFDHHNNYLKHLELNLSLPDYENIIKYNPDPIARIFGIEAIAKLSNLQALKVLENAFYEEEFWAVKSEIIVSLAKINLDQVNPILHKFLKNSYPKSNSPFKTKKGMAKLRLEILFSLSKIKTEGNYQIIKKIAQDGDESYMVEAISLKILGLFANSLANNFVNSKTNKSKKDYEKEALDIFDQTLKTKSGWNEYLRTGAISGLSHLNNSKLAVQKILEYTELGVPSSLRNTSIAKLGAVSKNQEDYVQNQIIDRLNELLVEPQMGVESCIITACSEIKSPRVLHVLSSIEQKSIYHRIKRKALETIELVQKNLGNTKTLSEIRKEFEEIKKENKDLKSKLEDILVKIENKKPTKK
jgi:aminopeptidase N